MIDPVQALSLMGTGTVDAQHGHGTARPTDGPIIIKPLPKFEEAGHAGNVTLWVIFVIMVVSSAGGALLSWRVPLKRRAFHTITTLIVIVAGISYFGMATGHAVSYRHTTKHVGNNENYFGTLKEIKQDVYREVFWARYVDWAITTPLLLLDLGVLAGMAGGHLLMMITADLIMVLTGLFAAVAHTDQQKWGWYAIACIAFLVVIWHLAINARQSAASSRSDKARKLYVSLAAYTLVLWTAYPIIWALGEGVGILNVNGEVIAYGILDVLAKPVFGFWLLFSHDVISDNSMDLNISWSGSSEGLLRLGDDGA